MQFELQQYFKNYSGLVDGNLELDYGDEVSLHYGCGLSLRGQMWYFGGRSGYKTAGYSRQVSLKAILPIQIIYF